MSYDQRAVKIPKSIKVVALSIPDKHMRGAFIKAHVEVLENAQNVRTTRNRRKHSIEE
jgi:hypothetical protein